MLIKKLSIYLFIFIFVFSAKAAEKTAVDKNSKILNIIDFAHTYNLNPHTSVYNSEAEILTGLFEGLYSYDPSSLEPIPALAKEYKISRNKLRWTFTIRENALFSDGSPITASAIRDSWIAMLANPNATFSSLLDCVTGVEEFRKGKYKNEQEIEEKAKNVGIIAKNDKTLVLTLTKPASHLRSLLCHHAFSAKAKKDGIYSGAFVVDSYDGKKLVLKKNDKYWDADNVALDSIIVNQSENPEENTYFYNMGKTDWVTGNITVNKLINQRNINISAEFGTQFLFFKNRENSIWNNSAFRIALLTAVPWNQLRGKSIVPASTLIYPIAQYPEVEGFSDTDADEALELMKQARLNANIPLDKELQILFALDDSDYMKEQYEILAKAWEPLGVKVIPQKTTTNDYLSNISFWNADLFAYTWIGDFADPVAFLELFRTNSLLNESKWSNKDFDKILDDASFVNDKNERYKLFAKAEQILLDEGVILPISHPVSMHVIDTSRVGGWTTNALDLHPLKYLYLKKAQVKVPNLVYKN